MKNKVLITLSYLYLYIPICLFLFGWVKPLIAVPIILISAYCLFSNIKFFPDIQFNIFENRKKLFIILGIIFIWVFLSGIGGFVWQNRWDHMFRNAIFKDLFSYGWPVVNYDGSTPVNLCYYIGFWLPSAFVAKLFNSITVGYIFQFLWGLLGVILAFGLISVWLKKVSYKTLLIFIFFSGLDIIAFIFLSFRHYIEGVPHIEFQTILFNSSSNTTLLFWLYNQIIPFWIGFMLLLLQKNKKYLFFTYSLLILFAPFPALALVPVIIFWELRDIKQTQILCNKLHRLFGE